MTKKKPEPQQYEFEDLKVKPEDKKLIRQIAAETGEKLFEVFHRLMKQEWERLNKK